MFQAWFGFRNIGKRGTQVEDILGEERQKRVVSKLHEIMRPFVLRCGVLWCGVNNSLWCATQLRVMLCFTALVFGCVTNVHYVMSLQAP